MSGLKTNIKIYWLTITKGERQDQWNLPYYWVVRTVSFSIRLKGVWSTSSEFWHLLVQRWRENGCHFVCTHFLSKDVRFRSRSDHKNQWNIIFNIWIFFNIALFSSGFMLNGQILNWFQLDLCCRDVVTSLERARSEDDGFEAKHVAYCFIFQTTSKDECFLRMYTLCGDLRLKYKGTVRRYNNFDMLLCE